MVNLTIYISEEEYNILLLKAREKGLKTAQLAQEILKAWVSEQKEKKEKNDQDWLVPFILVGEEVILRNLWKICDSWIYPDCHFFIPVLFISIKAFFNQ